MLKSTTPLNGFATTINDVAISEVSGRAIVSIAVPKNGEAKLKASIKKSLKIDMPQPGQFAQSKTANGQLIWASQDQYFYIFDEAGLEPEKEVEAKLDVAAYVTNQSDAFAMISVSGKRQLEALERICPIDLNPQSFTIGSAARTHMEHLGVLIMRVSTDEYVLLSASSSAASFLHAVETSAQNLDTTDTGNNQR